MAPNISLRHYVRWLPDPVPDEDNTTTIVTTSNENRFVDLRVFKEAFSVETASGQPLSQLEWGLAGTSSSTPAKGPNGEEITRGIWKHWIDSRCLDADRVQDEGDNYTLPNGLVLEKGSMVNPVTGKVTPYEEVWEDVEVEVIKQVLCVVVQLHDDSRKARGMVVRVGQFCQGILRVGSEVSVERWEWKEGSWEIRVRMGTMGLPCIMGMEPGDLKVGRTISRAQGDWTVMELTKT